MNKIKKAISLQADMIALFVKINAAQENIDLLNLAVNALREKAERENPKLLTLDDLRDMVGEPVFNEYENIWQIISDIDEVDELCTIINMTDGDEYDTEDGFPGFYRTKPTGGE